jgi:ADP-ribose pyrophosphatase
VSKDVISSKYIYKGRAVNLRVDTVKEFETETTTREIVEHADCVAIIPVDEANNVLMVRQYREAVAKYLLEIPAGGIDPGEEPADAVRRELQEEIGFLPDKITEIGGFYSAPGYCTEYLHLYLATDLKPSQLEAEDTAGIEIIAVPATKIKTLLASGNICDAKSVAGLLRFLFLHKNR